MHTIEIDFDVFKALTMRRESERVTYNDVIRELLGIGPARARSSAGAEADPQLASSADWVCKGVRFPTGTEFRARYKGKMHLGRVQDGVLTIDGRRADSPSDAARLITGNNVNGWNFWECRLPGESHWRSIKGLRGTD